MDQYHFDHFTINSLINRSNNSDFKVDNFHIKKSYLELKSGRKTLEIKG